MNFVDYTLIDGGILSVASSPEGYRVLVDGAAVAPPIAERLLRTRVSIDLADRRGCVGIRIEYDGGLEVLHNGQICRRSGERPPPPAGIARSRRLLVLLALINGAAAVGMLRFDPSELSPTWIALVLVEAFLHVGAALWVYSRPNDAWMAFTFIMVVHLAALAYLIHAGVYSTLVITIVYVLILRRGTINSWQARTAKRAPQRLARAA